MNVAVWELRDAGPAGLSPSDVELEERLEDWIESDPSLLQGIVGRQTETEAGPLDLLTETDLDPDLPKKWGWVD